MIKIKTEIVRYFQRHWKTLLLVAGSIAATLKTGVPMPIFVLAIDDFGINFANRVLRKFYERAVTPAVTNTDYEGEIKEFGDRVRILSFLHDISVSTYTAGTDMTTQALFDTTDELVINQQRYYNFAIDKVEELFTYGGDVADALIENAAKEVEKVVDNYTLSVLAGGARAGNWIGQNARIAGSSALTHASVATTAAGATLSVQTTSSAPNTASAELPDGTLIFAGFSSPEDLGKAVRLPRERRGRRNGIALRRSPIRASQAS